MPDNIGILNSVVSWKNDKICCIIKERAVVIWNTVIILFKTENKIINPPIISNVWIEETIASPSNFPIGLFLAYVSGGGLKKDFEKDVFSSVFIICVNGVITIKTH